MGIPLLSIVHAKQMLRRSLGQAQVTAPKGYLTVYVGESQKRRFLVLVSYLNQPSFQDLLRKSEEEFRFDHPMGGLTIPCREDISINLTSHMDGLIQVETENLEV